MTNARTELFIGLLGMALAAAALGWWIPLDVETGVLEQGRRRVTLGDSAFPTAVCIALFGASLAHAVGAWRRCALRAVEDAKPSDVGADAAFALRAAVVVGIALVFLVNSGPLVVEALQRLGADIGDYRALRDTAPYKYLGLLAGGGVLVAGLVSLIEGRLRASAILLAVLTVTALIAAYDLPFDDLLLPPNGDQ